MSINDNELRRQLIFILSVSSGKFDMDSNILKPHLELEIDTSHLSLFLQLPWIMLLHQGLFVMLITSSTNTTSDSELTELSLLPSPLLLSLRIQSVLRFTFIYHIIPTK